MMYFEESEVRGERETETECRRREDSKKADQALKCYLGFRIPEETLGAGAYSPFLQQKLYLQLLHGLQGEEGRAAVSWKLSKKPL